MKEMNKGLALLFASEKYFCNFFYFSGTLKNIRVQK
jgi:hypothetical protein